MEIKIWNIRREVDGHWNFIFKATGKVKANEIEAGYTITAEVYRKYILDLEVVLDKKLEVDPKTFKEIREKIEKEVIPQIKEVLKIS